MPTEDKHEIGRRLLIGSGAVGTMLRQGQGAGLPFVEILNLTAPDMVLALHRAYRGAGSDIIVTNTFAANPVLLEEAGWASEAEKINAAGVSLAREAAGDDRRVWASVGPLSLGLRGADYPPDRLREAYRVQCAGLLAADAILLETFQDEREASAALQAAVETGQHVIFQVGFTGRGSSGLHKLEKLLALAEEARVRAVGLNCRHPREILEAARHLLARTTLPVTVAPNAGTPSLARGRIVYEFSPESFRRVAESLWQMGVAVIGGCCGTTPDHVRAVSALLKGRPTQPRQPRMSAAETSLPTRTAAVLPENPVRARMRSDRFLISVEIRADRSSDIETLVQGAQIVAGAEADFLDVPDKPGASVARDATVVAARIQDATGVPAICHKAAVHCNLLEAHSSLVGCWDLGLRGLLAVTGDPPALGPLGSWASRVSDVKTSVELLRLISTLRSGAALSGETIADPPDFCAGCTVGRPIPAHLEWLRKKLDAGAEFVFSQPVFTVDDWRRLRDALAPMGTRLFPGLLPLVSRKNAEALASGRIPGIRVPAEVVERFAQYPSREDQRRFGLDSAEELARVIAREGRGLYLIMPFGPTCYHDAARLVKAARCEAP